MNSGITYARGFKASGISCGIKKNNKKDLALIYSDSQAIAAGLFTTNKVKSASILIDLKHLKKPDIRAESLEPFLASAIRRVAEYMMSDTCQMYPYLVSTACLKVDLEF